MASAEAMLSSKSTKFTRAGLLLQAQVAERELGPLQEAWRQVVCGEGATGGFPAGNNIVNMELQGCKHR